MLGERFDGLQSVHPEPEAYLGGGAIRPSNFSAAVSTGNERSNEHEYRENSDFHDVEHIL